MLFSGGPYAPQFYNFSVEITFPTCWNITSHVYPAFILLYFISDLLERLQNRGRAGRTFPGKCFHLYSKDIYEGMRGRILPEILRVELSHVVLKLYQLGIKASNGN